MAVIQKLRKYEKRCNDVGVYEANSALNFCDDESFPFKLTWDERLGCRNVGRDFSVVAYGLSYRPGRFRFPQKRMQMICLLFSC